MKCVAVFVFILLFSTLSLAEYRVFLLKIAKAPPSSGQPERVRYVQSTLDPEQYPLYYPVYPDEKVSYTETWRCFGRTSDFKAFCPNPRAPASDQISSPQTAPN